MKFILSYRLVIKFLNLVVNEIPVLPELHKLSSILKVIIGVYGLGNKPPKAHS